MYKDMFFMYIQKDFSMIFFLNVYVQRIFKKLSKICTNFKMNICTRVLVDFFSKVCTKWFSLIFFFKNIHENDFFLSPKRVFNVESGVPCKTEFIGC